ncbi:MAG: hypothetical protein RIE23_07930 [Pontimonas sp.]
MTAKKATDPEQERLKIARDMELARKKLRNCVSAIGDALLIAERKYLKKHTSSEEKTFSNGQTHTKDYYSKKNPDEVSYEDLKRFTSIVKEVGPTLTAASRAINNAQLNSPEKESDEINWDKVFGFKPGKKGKKKGEPKSNN